MRCANTPEDPFLPGRSLWIPALLLLALAGGVLRLLLLPLDTGDAYPPYSSLRAEPTGTKALHDALAEAGFRVQRHYFDLSRLRVQDAVIFYLGVDPAGLGNAGREVFAAIRGQVRAGNRLVVGFRPSTLPPAQPPESWGVRIEQVSDPQRPGPLYFASARGWTVVSSAGGRATRIERTFGEGSVVLLADSSRLTNQGLAMQARGSDVAWLAGGHEVAVFDEAHLGIRQSGSIMALARQYRLHGLFLAALTIAGLFIWRSMASFPPQRPAPAPGAGTGRDAFTGFVSLLARHITPTEAASLAWVEWRKTNAHRVAAERSAAIEQIVRPAPGWKSLAAAREVLKTND